MTAQFKEALIRALFIAFVTGLSSGTTAELALHHHEDSILVGVAAFASSMLIRFGLEGYVDSNRAKIGAVQPSDVGADLILDQPPEPTPSADAPHGA